MIGWIYLAVLVLSLIPLRNVITTGLHNEFNNPDDAVGTSDLLAGAALGLFLAAIWPLALLVGLLAYLPRYFAPSAAEKRAALAAREDALRERERRIEELERQLEIER